MRNQSQKRGGGQKLLSLDEQTAEQIYLIEPSGCVAPESLFDKRWALTLLDRAMVCLGRDYSARGQGELFNRLKGFLLAEASGDFYREAGRELGLTEGAVKVALHRLRQRFRDAVRAEVAQTVASPGEIDGELRSLMAALNG